MNATRKRLLTWLVALAFGLLHGLGFAGKSSEAGLPQGRIPLVSLFFSLRVEAGHFLFIGVVLSIIALARRAKLPVPQWAQLVPPYAIGLGEVLQKCRMGSACCLCRNPPTLPA